MKAKSKRKRSQKPAPQSGTKTAPKASAKPASQPVEQAAVQPVEQPVVQPVEQPAVQPVEQPAVQPVEQPAVQPVEQPAAQSAAKAAPKAAEKPAPRPAKKAAAPKERKPSAQDTGKAILAAAAQGCGRAGRATAKACRHIARRLGPLLRRMGRWLKENFGVKGSEAGRIALSGLIYQNPTFVLLLGLCPTLATTTSLQNGLGMGLSTLAVLVCSSLVISLLRRVVPGEVRAVAHVVVSATFATIADLLLQTFAPGLSAALGLYVPLIAVNSVILGRGEVFASRHKPGASLLDGLFMGLGFTAALAILGAVREVLGAGTIWGVAVPVLHDYPVGLVLSPGGGFILLGCLVAFAQWLRTRPRKGGQKA